MTDLEARSFLVQHWRSEWGVEGLVVLFEKDLLGGDPRSYDSPKGSVLEDPGLEGGLEDRTLEKVGPSVLQQLLPTEAVPREARFHTEVQEALKTEQHCRTGMAVALVEKGLSLQAALVRFLEHIGHWRPQGMTA